jgi:hypothetical protein
MFEDKKITTALSEKFKKEIIELDNMTLILSINLVCYSLGVCRI